MDRKSVLFAFMQNRLVSYIKFSKNSSQCSGNLLILSHPLIPSRLIIQDIFTIHIIFNSYLTNGIVRRMSLHIRFCQ